MLALVLWGLDGFNPATPDAVKNLALTLPGIIAGVMAVALNAPPPGNG